MDFDAAQLYETGTRIMIAVAVLVFLALRFIDAPYGRHLRGGWGPTLSARLGWVIMELPSPIAMSIAFFSGEGHAGLWPLFFFALYQLHYLQRSVIYPLLMRAGGKPTTLFTVVAATIFNCANGALCGLAVSQIHTYPTAWGLDPRFLIGTALFVGGAIINVHADAVLRGLRKPGETGYRIPHGGLYRLVSCPNYLGEILEWSGWAIATWSAAGLAFAIFTAANLLPRARANHLWYREQFPDYPSERRAIIPHVF